MNENMEAELFRYIESIAINTEQIAASLARIEITVCNPPFIVKTPATSEELEALLQERGPGYVVNPDGTTHLPSSSAPPSSEPAPVPVAGTEELPAQSSAAPPQK